MVAFSYPTHVKYVHLAYFVGQLCSTLTSMVIFPQHHPLIKETTDINTTHEVLTFKKLRQDKTKLTKYSIKLVYMYACTYM